MDNAATYFPMVPLCTHVEGSVRTVPLAANEGAELCQQSQRRGGGSLDGKALQRHLYGTHII